MIASKVVTMRNQVGCRKWTVKGTVHSIALAYIPEYMICAYFREAYPLPMGCHERP